MKRAILIYMMLCLITPITVEAKKKKFGKNLFWELTEDGTLIISGNGEMPRIKYSSSDYRCANNYPWFKQGRLIKRIVIEEDVASIGDYSFWNCDLTSITIPNSVTSNGNDAFSKWNSPNI